jgi:hypothetical protein
MSQGYNDRLDESLGVKDGAESTKSQSYKDRRDESRGMTDRHHHRQHGLAGGNTFQQVFDNMVASNRAGHKSPNQPMN